MCVSTPKNRTPCKPSTNSSDKSKRSCATGEAEERFGDAFISLARAVYRCNDERAALKRAINLRHGSQLVEEKSYRSP